MEKVTSRLAEMQARFQQKQMEEKEQMLTKLYESQQQRTIDRVGRNSAGSNTSNASSNSLGSTGGGKVRAMFDERRQKAGVDKSYPLKPLESRSNGRSVSLGRQASKSKATAIKTTTTRKSTGSVIQNGNNRISEGQNRINLHEGFNNNSKNSTANKTHTNSLKHKNSTSSLLGLIDNNHNLDDILDNQYLPDELDSQENFMKQPHYMTRKISNVGGKLLSQLQKEIDNRDYHHSAMKESLSDGNKNNFTKTQATRGTTKPKASSKPTSQTEFSISSAPGSPSNKNMSNKPTSLQRAPLNNRPSAKQTAKSGVVRDDLADCRFCGRRFATDRLGKHEDICGKTAKKKRKAYDSTKHRVQGTELEGYVLKGGRKGASTSKVPPKVSSTGSKTNWRRTHEEFLAAIKAAKQAQAYVAKGGKLTDLPPPPPSSNPDYVQCPHCGRRFNEAAAERHIPKCATYQYNKPKPGAKR